MRTTLFGILALTAAAMLAFPTAAALPDIPEIQMEPICLDPSSSCCHEGLVCTGSPNPVPICYVRVLGVCLLKA